MRHNFTSNRLNDYCQFYTPSTEVDDYGKPTQVDFFSFDCRANIDEKSGSQAQSMGKTLTDSIITILTYFHYSVSSDQIVRYNGARYQVEHIQPDSVKQAMIVTCSLLGAQEYSTTQQDYPPTGPNEPDEPNNQEGIRVGVPLEGVTQYEYTHIGRTHPRIWFVSSDGEPIDVDYHYGESGIISIVSGFELTGTLYIE